MTMVKCSERHKYSIQQAMFHVKHRLVFGIEK